MKRSARVLPLLLPLLGGACTVPRFDVDTLEGKNAIMDGVNLALTTGDCGTAIGLIEPLYSSTGTDNQVRMLRASAHGCFLGVNFLELLVAFGSKPLGSASLWSTSAELFYSADQELLDKRITSGRLAQDALMAMLNPGTVLGATQLIDRGGGLNIGSTVPGDRTRDANLYLAMTSLATFSALQNRYSATDPTNFSQGAALGFTAARPQGWADPLNYVPSGDAEGCLFAASVLNFTDAVDEIVAAAGGGGSSAVTALATMNTIIKAQLSAACEAGCKADPAALIFPSAIPVDFSGTGCALVPDTCNDDTVRPCPLALRNYGLDAAGNPVCTPAVTDRNTCAAAGIATMINDGTALGSGVGWTGP